MRPRTPSSRKDHEYNSYTTRETCRDSQKGAHLPKNHVCLPAGQTALTSYSACKSQYSQTDTNGRTNCTYKPNLSKSAHFHRQASPILEDTYLLYLFFVLLATLLTLSCFTHTHALIDVMTLAPRALSTSVPIYFFVSVLTILTYITIAIYGLFLLPWLLHSILSTSK